MILAFDTATSAATSAVVRNGEPLGERVSTPGRVLEDVDALLAAAGLEPTDVDAVVVGTGPGSFTGLRMGVAIGRALALALDVPLAGVSTLDALAAGAPGATPVIDAGRREVFTVAAGRPVFLRPDGLELEPGTICVGSGAIRYRAVLEAAGAEVPPDASELHLPRARFHALLASDFGPPEAVEPIYLRVPDAERSVSS